MPLRMSVLEAQLVDLHEVLGRHGITFWLRDGTALGAVRDGRLIPYDDDADLGIWAVSLPKLDAALEELVGRKFVVYKRNSSVVGLLRGWETTELCISGVEEKPDEYETVRERFFRELTPLAFLGRDFLVPRETERYLEFSYGPNWRVPKIDAWSNSCWLPTREKLEQARNFGPKSDEG